MRDPLSNVPIKFKLTATFVGICFLAFGVGGYLISTAVQKTLEKEITFRLQSQAKAISGMLDAHLELLSRRAEDFASDGFIRTQLASATVRRETHSHPEFNNIAHSLQKHLVENKFPLIDALRDLRVCDTAGVIIAQVDTHAAIQMEEMILEVKHSDTLWYSSLFAYGSQDSTPVFVLATPVMDIQNTSHIGYIIFVINAISWVQKSQQAFFFASSDSTGKDMIYSIRDRKVNTLEIVRKKKTPFTTTTVLEGKLISASMLDHAPARPHAGRHVCTGGADRFGFQYTISHSGWKLNVELDAEHAMLPVSRIQSRFLGAGLLFAFASVILLFFPIRFLVRPLVAMQEAARKMTNGDFSVRVEANANDEIGDLAHAFNIMAEATEERTNKLEETASLLESRSMELKRERDLLNSVVLEMQDGLILLDRDGGIALYNAAAIPLVKAILGKAILNVRRPFDVCEHHSQCLECLTSVDESAKACVLDIQDAILEIVATPLEADGKIQGRILVARDVTERTRLDERQAHQERLAVLGEVSAVMAHELNNPLAAISMFNQMMETELPADSPFHEHITVIKRNTDACKRTIRDLLSFSAGARPEINDVNIIELISEVIHFLKPLYEKEEIAFHLHFEDGEMVVRSDEMYLRQVLVNVLLNAIQALETSGGKIDISSTFDEELSVVQVRIRDNGPGIPDEVRARVFDPFVTSKSNGKGTGLGLSTSRKIMEAFGGKLELVQSVPGNTEFLLTIPIEAPENAASLVDTPDRTSSKP